MNQPVSQLVPVHPVWQTHVWVASSNSPCSEQSARMQKTLDPLAPVTGRLQSEP